MTDKEPNEPEIVSQNPSFPEEINTGKREPLKELLQLTAGVLLLLTVVFIVIWQSLSYIAGWIPLAWETNLTEPFQPAEMQRTEQEQALQERLELLLDAMNYEDDAKLTVHVLEQSEINAFATLGGHIFVFQGLLDALQTDIGLDMVLAHEAAHILNRDPIQSAASTLGFQLFMALVTGSGDIGNSTGLINSGSELLALTYSRSQERQADDLALDALSKLYTDLTDADELVSYIAQLEGQGRTPEFLSSHPHPDRRIEAIQQRINP